MKLSRRSLVLGCGARLFSGVQSRLAICSETFAGLKFAEACKAARRTGYDGIEIEPAHLGEDPAALPGARRLEIKRLMDQEHLLCPGIHSFLKAPAGLHLSAPDAAIRKKSWDYFARLIDLAADLTARPVMVFGSSKQRAAIDGATPSEAIERLKDGLSEVAPQAAQRGVTILVEPLAPHLCNVINTLEEAMAVVRAVNSPAVETMFDCHNTAAEKKPLDALIRQYLAHIRHVHLNETDGRRPGTANFPFELVLRTLKESGYPGWLSVEVFDFKPDGETVARLSGEYLRGVIGRI
jgi:sugar phosphate isomerase/epimerase